VDVSFVLGILLLPYEKIKHIVEVDEKILAVFIIDSNGKISDLFIAPDARIDRSFIETIKSKLNIKFETMEGVKEEIQPSTNLLGRHLWDISEYDNVRVLRIYESNRLIVVLAKSHTSPGDVAETVLGYLYESDEEEEQQEPPPPCLF
jgi:hypothetical protein